MKKFSLNFVLVFTAFVTLGCASTEYVPQLPERTETKKNEVLLMDLIFNVLVYSR